MPPTALIDSLKSVRVPRAPPQRSAGIRSGRLRRGRASPVGRPSRLFPESCPHPARRHHDRRRRRAHDCSRPLGRPPGCRPHGSFGNRRASRGRLPPIRRSPPQRRRFLQSIFPRLAHHAGPRDESGRRSGAPDRPESAPSSPNPSGIPSPEPAVRSSSWRCSACSWAANISSPPCPGF